MTFFESIFEFLFKYRPVVFEKGDLAFAAPWPLLALLAVGGVAALLALAGYARARRRSAAEPRDVILLSALRVAVFALLLWALARPTLLVPTVVPQRNFLGIVVDDSRSMEIADENDSPRGAFVYENFGAPDSALYAALAERFLLRFFRFSDGAHRMEAVGELGLDGRRTDLAVALDRARRDLAAVPLAGLILVTDGADNSESSLTETLLALNAGSVPVYTVGLGRERYDRDVEVSRVETPRSVLKGSSLAVDVTVEQTGYAGKRVQLNVEEEGRIVASQEVTLPGNGETATLRINFEAERAGPRMFRFHIPPLEGERVTQNNTRESLIIVQDKREKILYFEGEPRFELKFIRRAVAEDGNIQIVSLQRTAENKFYRLDVDNADELAAGFPRTREELFAYRGLIVGSVEASFFTHDQLSMIEEFVGQRGGGVLFLGGRRAFAEGGYAGTPVADVMPVVLDTAAGPDETHFAEVTVEPTRFGRGHPATQIAEGAEESARRWAELPAVSTVNRIVGVKPGASTLLTARAVESSDEHVALAYQRYGRGKALALPIQDSWLWQMHADVPLDDLSHETFWRQLARWLVAYVPERVVVEPEHDRVDPGRPTEISAEVQDETFLRVNGAQVTAIVTGPAGTELELPMEWALEEDGRYSVGFTPEVVGLYEVRVEAHKGDKFFGGSTTYFQTAHLDTEYFNSEMRADLLRRIADETGGRFYTPTTVGNLPEDVSVTDSGATVVEERDLWDMPIVFLMLLVLIGSEWGYRRFRGLV